MSNEAMDRALEDLRSRIDEETPPKILKVDERDISYVEPQARGLLTLSSLPGEKLPLTVERVTPVASADAST